MFVRPEFELTRENAAAVGEICSMLDGLPLAIELAAARSKLFDPHELLRRFPSRLDLGSDGPVDATPKHRTLRDTLAWSYNLLGAEAQTLFRLMGVFVGGCSESAAEAVCADDERFADALHARLGALVDHGLLRHSRSATGELRYGMFETVREFALEQLRECGEDAETRRLHAAHYRALAEDASAHLRQGGSAPWFTRLDEDHNNLRAALRWSWRQRDARTLLRLVAALAEYWCGRLFLAEGQAWVDRAMAIGDDAPTLLRAHAANAAGRVSQARTDYLEAQRLWRQSLELYQIAGNPLGIARVTSRIGSIALTQGEFRQSIGLAETGLSRLRELGDAEDVVEALGVLAWVELLYIRHDRAKAYAEESIALAHEQGITYFLANAYICLGLVEFHAGEFDTAARRHEQGLVISRQTENLRGISVATMNLGVVTLLQRDGPLALAYFRESLQLFEKTQDRSIMVYCLEGVAGAIGILGDEPIRAARLMGGAKGVRDLTGVDASHLEAPYIELLENGIKSKLDDATWDAAWNEGRLTPLEQLLPYALESTELGSRNETADARSSASAE